MSDYNGELSVSLCSSIGFCFMCFDTLLLGTYVLRIVMSLWRIDLFIIMKCLFISHSVPEVYFA